MANRTVVAVLRSLGDNPTLRFYSDGSIDTVDVRRTGTGPWFARVEPVSGGAAMPEAPPSFSQLVFEAKDNILGAVAIAAGMSDYGGLESVEAAVRSLRDGLKDACTYIDLLPCVYNNGREQKAAWDRLVAARALVGGLQNGEGTHDG